MLMLLVLPPDNSFMVLVLCTITYRHENKHRATADLTARVWAESAANLHGVHDSLDVQLRCPVNKKQFSGHGPLNPWPYLAQPPSYLVTLVLGAGKLVCSNCLILSSVLLCISKT